MNPETSGFASQVAAGLALAYLEASGRFNIPYSKFSAGGRLDVRLAAFFVYFIPLAAYVYTYHQAGAPRSPYHLALLAGFSGHFAKRCLETLFLHRFSKGIGLPVAAAVTLLYTSVALSAGRLHNLETSAAAGQALSTAALALGGALMLAGETVNFYHHLLLARLRGDGRSGYRIPAGGLFELVACPHYLAEIIAWTGYAVMSRRLGMFGTLFIFTCYLAARSRRTSEWYKENVPGYPRERGALVPCLF